MIHYAKIKDSVTCEVTVGTGTNVSFYESIGMEKMDVEQAYNGRWFLVGFAPTPTKEEQLDALTAEYRQEKTNLCESYTTASMQGDSETSQSVAADMADLDAWYDEEYQKIEGSVE